MDQYEDVDVEALVDLYYAGVLKLPERTIILSSDVVDTTLGEPDSPNTVRRCNAQPFNKMIRANHSGGRLVSLSFEIDMARLVRLVPLSSNHSGSWIVDRLIRTVADRLLRCLDYLYKAGVWIHKDQQLRVIGVPLRFEYIDRAMCYQCSLLLNNFRVCGRTSNPVDLNFFADYIDSLVDSLASSEGSPQLTISRNNTLLAFLSDCRAPNRTPLALLNTNFFTKELARTVTLAKQQHGATKIGMMEALIDEMCIERKKLLGSGSDFNSTASSTFSSRSSSSTPNKGIAFVNMSDSVSRPRALSDNSTKSCAKSSSEHSTSPSEQIHSRHHRAGNELCTMAHSPIILSRRDQRRLKKRQSSAEGSTALPILCSNSDSRAGLVRSADSSPVKEKIQALSTRRSRKRSSAISINK